MIGIKGVGMTMLAQFLMEKGYRIIGSDVSDEFLTDKVLEKSGIVVKTPFAVSNIPEKVDLIVYSSAFNAKNNCELKYLSDKAHLDKNIKIISYAQALGDLFNKYKGIAVCGSHGKTTTSAWLGYVLLKSGKSPNILVGSRVPQFQGSSIKGDSKLFVAEVDEYQNKLQYFLPFGVILNNIDYDHPDFFKTEKDYVQVFLDFVKKIPTSGFLVVNGEDKESMLISRKSKGQVISYAIVNEKDGMSQETVNYLAYNLKNKNGYQYFTVNNLGEFKIKLWGRHNVQNALAVIASSLELKVPLGKLKKYLASFSGTARRAQVLGVYKGATIIDDYAHHPTEIKATLQGLKERYKQKKIRVVFHPHTFTRTKALFSDFVRSFSDIDELVVLDIYGSAREKKGGVSSFKLVKAIEKENRKHNVNQEVKNIKDIKLVVKYLKKTIQKDEVIVLMGAGDVFRVADNLLK